MILDGDGRPLTPVHICWSDSEAEVVVGLLKSHGVEAMTNSELPHSVLPIIADGLGEVQVLVSEESAVAALSILEAKERIESVEEESTE